jgi:hypothetical protein
VASAGKVWRVARLWSGVSTVAGTPSMANAGKIGVARVRRPSCAAHSGRSLDEGFEEIMANVRNSRTGERMLRLEQHGDKTDDDDKGKMTRQTCGLDDCHEGDSRSGGGRAPRA